MCSSDLVHAMSHWVIRTYAKKVPFLGGSWYAQGFRGTPLCGVFNREPGENPGLSRSGIGERKLQSTLAETGWEVATGREPLKSEDLPGNSQQG